MLLEGFSEPLPTSAFPLRTMPCETRNDSRYTIVGHHANLSRNFPVRTLSTSGYWCTPRAGIDIDRFKTINDTYGHNAGDAALVDVVELARNLLRDSDVLARFGGDELVIVLPCMSCDQALGVAERLRKAVKCHTVNVTGQSVHITISLGLTAFTPGADESDALTLMSQADAALYAAKRQGRDKTVVAACSMIDCEACTTHIDP
ncbi:MAG: GGDEF domain-containing protein [Marinobacter sp.]